MKRIILLKLIFSFNCFFCLTGYGQINLTKTWILGYNTSPGITGTKFYFANDSLYITPLNKQYDLNASSTVVNDNNGDLLFYGNGCNFIDKNHNLLLNGDSLSQDLLAYYCEQNDYPLIQTLITLQKPLSSNLFFSFYPNLIEISPTELSRPTKLYYSILNTNLNNGLGGVESKNNLLIDDTLSMGQYQACKGLDGNSWWIIIPRYLSNCYYTIHLNQNGIDTVFKQCSGLVWTKRDNTGQSVFTPDHKKYIRSNFYNGLNIFDFDNSTGLLSNPKNISLGTETFPFAGAAVSSNSRYLYTMNYTNVYQFDLRAADIENSKTFIAHLTTPSNIINPTSFAQSMLGPDGRIYIAGTNTHMYFHVIKHPNCPGLSCDLQQYAIPLYSYNYHSIPNFPHFYDWDSNDTCDLSTGIIFTPEMNNFFVYYNKSNNLLNIITSDPFTGRIYLFSSSGQSIETREVVSPSTEFQIESQHLTPGLYVVSLIDKSGNRRSAKVLITY